MAELTKIEWATHTFNPWWGCTKVAAECENCYAETFSKRTGHIIWGPKTDRRELSDTNWRKPHKWNAAAEKSQEEQTRVFCGSMCDVLEDHPTPNRLRPRLWETIEATPALTWLLLTKRPQNALAMMPAAWKTSPPRNVWWGTSAGSEKTVNEALLHLIRIPAAMRFVSAEPLLGPVYLSTWLTWAPSCYTDPFSGETVIDNGSLRIHWVILGGESGPRARPCDLRWIRYALRDCREAGAAPFVKQLGAKPHDGHMEEVLGEGRHFLRLKDPKGGDPSEWPPDLRVREFPEAVRCG